MIATPGRTWRGALLALGAVLGAAPGNAVEPNEVVYSKFKIDTYLHKWSVKDWTIWAMPNHVCLAMKQDIDPRAPHFWGFIVKDGLEVELFFGSIENAAPQTVQITFNSGKPVSFPARVEPMDGANAYVVPFTLEYLWTMQDDIDIDVFANGNRIFSGWTKVMGKIAEGLEKCDNWQAAH